MITVNKAITANFTIYYWDAKKERFGFGDDYLNHGFAATHKIVVDAGLTAQELDAIFEEVL
jgi:hypothetical protein